MVEVPRRCSGKTYLLAGTFEWDEERRFREAIIGEGGQLAAELADDVGVVVVGRAQHSRTKPTEAAAAARGIRIVLSPSLRRFYCQPARKRSR